MPLWIVFSVCTYLASVTPNLTFCCWSAYASRFDMLCIQKCSCCKVWLHELVLLFYQLEPVASELFYQQSLSTHRIVIHWNFSFFPLIIFCKPCLCVKMLIYQQFSKILRPPHLALMAMLCSKSTYINFFFFFTVLMHEMKVSRLLWPCLTPSLV